MEYTSLPSLHALPADPTHIHKPISAHSGVLRGSPVPRYHSAKTTLRAPAGVSLRFAPEPGFWYGTKALWTWIPTDSRWWLGGQKIVYWRDGFDARKARTPGFEDCGATLVRDFRIISLRAVCRPEFARSGN